MVPLGGAGLWGRWPHSHRRAPHHAAQFGEGTAGRPLGWVGPPSTGQVHSRLEGTDEEVLPDVRDGAELAPGRGFCAPMAMG